jgi:hypothetical protein
MSVILPRSQVFFATSVDSIDASLQNTNKLVLTEDGIFHRWNATDSVWEDVGGTGGAEIVDELPTTDVKEGESYILKSNGGYYYCTGFNAEGAPIWSTTNMPDVGKSNVAVGNVVANQDLTGKSTAEILEAIFNPYVASSVSSLSLNGFKTGSVLLGDTILASSTSGFTWNFTNGTDALNTTASISASNKPTNYTFTNQSVTLADKASSYSGGTTPIVASTLGDTVKFRITASYTDSRTGSSVSKTADTAAASVVQSMYWGMSSDSLLAMELDSAVETAAKALKLNATTNAATGAVNGTALPTSAKSFVATSAYYIAIAVPATYIAKAGASGKRLSASVGSATGADISLTNDGVVAKARVVEMTNAAGYKEDYYVFETPAPLTWGAGGTSMFLSWKATR